MKLFRKHKKPESSLVIYAKNELALAGLFDKDSDYGGDLGKAALDIVKLFANQGHSGFSAMATVDIVSNLLLYHPLSPLTYGPEEWEEVGPHLWQNKRDSRIFSVDGGKTHYDVDNVAKED